MYAVTILIICVNIIHSAFCCYIYACIAVGDFMGQFLDEKDSGDVITTHIQLLLGCAIPVWLSYQSVNTFLPLAGVLSIGVGDAVAAAWGSRCVMHAFIVMIWIVSMFLI